MLRSLIRKITRREAGQALPLFGLFLFVFIGFVAMSIDVGRYVWARTQMQAAVDASALAAAQSLPDQADATQKATDYWLDNSGFIQSQGSNITYSVSYPPGNKKIAVEASADIPTWFARLFGVDEWHVAAEGDAESIVIDAMLVLDRSGSMCWDSHSPYGNYYSQLRLASGINNSTTTLTVNKRNPTMPGNQAPQALSYYVYIGQEFRIDNEWMRVTAITEPNTITVTRGVNGSSKASHSSNAYLRGDSCQTAGKGPYYPWEYVKTGARVFVDTFNADYDRIGYVQFSTRGYEESALTNAFPGLKSAIANSPDPTAGGSADQYTNIAHGTYMGIKEFLDNGRTNAKWVLIVLSDGVANRYCNPDQTTTCTSLGTNSATATQRAKDMAQLAQDHGITIYTIGYGNASDDALMQYMADQTGGKFFKAPDEQQLHDAFLAISKLTHIRLSR
ncbi:MAG: VWA domain-containing protein [Dehalococcoidia bacterium]|nr:VWA domain-containing protein [Dehalococcoidia bacterium]